MGLLEGKVVVITGAGGGIGREHALAMSKEGAAIVVNDLGGARDGGGDGGNAMADETVELVKKAGGEAVANYANVATVEGGLSILKTATDTFDQVLPDVVEAFHQVPFQFGTSPPVNQYGFKAQVCDLPGGETVFATDTVGFVRKLPHELVQAFRTTLDVVRDADLLVHVVDGSGPDPVGSIDAVRRVLSELDAADLPELLVFNKSDLGDAAARLADQHEGSVAASAHTGAGIDDLLRVIGDRVRTLTAVTELLVPWDRGDVIAAVHREGLVRMIRAKKALIAIPTVASLRCNGRRLGSRGFRGTASRPTATPIRGTQSGP